MGLMQKFFGRKQPTAAAGEEALARLEAEASAAEERVRKADAALGQIADMTDAEHEATIAEQAAAGRAAARAAAQVRTMRATVEDLRKTEMAAARKRERDEAERRVVEDYPDATAQYERGAADVAAALAKMAGIDADVARINSTIVADRREGVSGDDGLALIETSDARYRSEPDTVEPDRVVVEDRVMAQLPRFDKRDEERWAPAQLTVKDEDGLVLQPGEKVRSVERVIPGRVRHGRRMSSPAYDAVLPAARLDGKPFWPRGQ